MLFKRSLISNLLLKATLIATLASCAGQPGSPGFAGANGKDGVNGQDGATGATGPKGDTGATGANGTSITVVVFCPNATPHYPSTFPEVGLCIGNKLYAVYSTNGGFLAEIVPGYYNSNAVGSNCNFHVTPNCGISW